MPNKILSLAVMVTAGVALVSGCNSSSSKASGSSAMPSMTMPAAGVSASTAASDAAIAEPVVHIKNFQFSAPSKPIKAGEMFMVINDDSAAHTYESVKPAFDSGTIKPGASVMVKAPAAGTYAIKCDFHPFMHGTLTVT